MIETLFEYKNQELFFAGRSLVDFLKQHPDQDRAKYVYHADLIRQRLQQYQQAFSSSVKIFFAMKANHCPQVLKLIQQQGCGVDVVSGGELQWALDHGFRPDQIVFSGVGKSNAELELAVQKEIFQINVESESELLRLIKISQQKKKKVKVAVRLNPDVNPITHPYIATGFRENKFGIESDHLLPLIHQAKDTWVQIQGISVHIGSQLLQLDALTEAFQKTKHWVQSQGLSLQTLDLGGGLGIFYDRDDLKSEVELLKQYAGVVKDCFQNESYQLLAEPGRWIVGHAGVLLTQVVAIKKTSTKTFVILQSGMNHLMRPSLYQAQHRILPLIQKGSASLVDVVGPICESSDVLLKNTSMTEVEEGDWVAIADAGAYGFVMANNYNLHALPIEYLI